MKLESKWTAVRLGDLGVVFTGRTPPTEHAEYFGDAFPFITPGDMHQGKYARVTQRGVSNEGAQHLARIKLPANSICVSCIGWQMGEVILTDREAFTNQQINSIVPHEEVDPSFVYYFFKTMKSALLSLGTTAGARTPILNKSAFSDLKLLLPSRETQRRIASILGAYDDLIELNRRRITLLEEMAGRHFEEWFVHFRFPGHVGGAMIETPAGPIPKGWHMRAIDEVFEIMGGGTPSKAEASYWDGGNISWYTPTDLTASKTVFVDASSLQITDEGLRRSSAQLFPAFSVMMTSRATLGVISINTTKASTNQGFITCIPNESVPLCFLRNWLQQKVPVFIANASGSTFKEITKGVFRQLPIVLPPEELVATYENLARVLFDMVLNLERAQRKLAQCRDLLLPRLISGELSLFAAERELEAVA